MGLDMYLSTSFYVGGWDHYGKEGKKNYNTILKLLGLPLEPCPDSPSLTVDATIAYWRKSNQIHSWFVRNCQDGKDECQRTYVDRSKLQALVDDCKLVLASRGTEAEKYAIEKYLEPTSGFFFGSTAIDDYYWSDLQNTVDKLEAILLNPAFKGSDFYYRSSW